MKKKDKLLKTFMACAYASAGIALLGFVSFFANIGVSSAAEKSAKENGYTEFNQQYKAEKLAELTDKFNAGEITNDKFLEASKSIEDYDMNSYMEEYANAEELKSYKKLKKADEILEKAIWAIPTGIGLFASTGIPAIAIELKNVERKKSEKQEEASEEISVSETKMEYVDYEYVSEYGGNKVPVAWDVTPEGKLQKPEVPEIKFEK